MNRPTCHAFLLALLIFASVATPVLASISVAPLSVQFETAPGETDVATFVLRNTGDEPADITVTLHDWWRTADGGFVIYAPETLERSCAAWTVYSPEVLSLDPGEEAAITVELLVPEEILGDHWAVLLVEEQPKPAEQEQAEEGLTNTTRVVVTYAVKILYVDPLHRDLNAEIRGIDVLQEDPLLVKLDFANTGTSHVTTTGVVEIRDIFGETARSFEVDPFPSLPGEEKILWIEDPAEARLEEGLYYVVAVFDFGGDHLIQGGLQLEIGGQDTSNGP